MVTDDMLDTTLPHPADAWSRAARANIEGVDAEQLLMHVLGRTRSWLYAHGDAVVPAAEGARFAALVARRAAGEPIAYLIGTRGFWTFDLAVTPDTLIPRAETEWLVELALARIPHDRATRIADLGTGSGAIALALARERPLAVLVATDASAAALEVARNNADALRVHNVEFHEGDWLRPIADERFDAILSNPPYIETDDPHLAQGDLRHEPLSALVSGSDGLDAIRTIARDAPASLVRGGWLMLEHGWRQGDAVRALLSAAGFVDVATSTDLEGRDRVTLGRNAGAWKSPRN